MDISDALNKFKFMRENDVPLFDISRELGISMATLRRWEGDRKKSESRYADKRGVDPGNVSLSIHVDVWRDIGVVMGRLSVGVVVCALLFKAAGFIKILAVVLTGGSHF